MEIENEVTISTHNGSQVARQHNLRNPKVIAKEDHIDPNGHFEVWLDEDPKVAYERLFGEAVQAYNAKQKREDRQITDYYKQICEDSKKKPVYELIIGIYGKKADGTPICSKNDGRRILRAFTEDWERRNPHLKLCGLYYHCDESVGVNGSQVGHVHIDYIPVGDGFSRGMATQSSLTRALEQQGFVSQGINNTAQIQWEARENQFLASLCAHAGFEVVRGKGSKEHLDTATYKKVKELQELQERQAALSQEIAELQDSYETLRAQKSLSQAVMEAYNGEELEIEVQRTPAKTNPITKQTTPAQVTMTEADYLMLRERAAATTWMRRALENLKHMGERLTRELNQRRRVAELQERASSAEVAARSAELNLANAKAEIADLRQQAQEQQEWMEQQTTRSGKSIWEFFMDFITKQRERELVDRDERN